MFAFILTTKDHQVFLPRIDKDYYTEKTIQIVADWYQKDIDYWGFDFDSSATKNYYFHGKKTK